MRETTHTTITERQPDLPIVAAWTMRQREGEGIAAVMAALEMTGNAAGTFDDLLAEWLSLGPLETRTNAWHRRFDSDGIASGAFSDRAVSWLQGQGATGETLDRLWRSFWLVRLP